jgi:spore coat polysaccharide biosynthesis protein SpsF
MKIAAIIQARTTSERFPNKVLKSLPFGSQERVIDQVIKRVKAANAIDEVILATTVNSEDDELVAVANDHEIKIFRGSESNVLERFYQAASENKADFIVRITSDCPCLDPMLIDTVINDHLKNGYDFTSTGLKRTFPYGIDFSLFSYKILSEAYHGASTPKEKEHVTPYFYQTQKEKYQIHHFTAPSKYANTNIRLTLDTEEDYILLCTVYDHLYEKNEYFNLDHIINLFVEKPWIFSINKSVIQKKLLPDLDSELKEVLTFTKINELGRAEKWI